MAKRSGFAAQDTSRIDFQHTLTATVCGSWGCIRGGLEGEAKLSITPVVHQAFPREVLMHVS